MPRFSSISTFRNSLDDLCKKHKDGYYSCKDDICSIFLDKSFDDIWGMNRRIRESKNIRIIKVRLQNSCQNLSSADGFRVILCCNKNTETVILLNIFPKRGKLQMLDQSPDDYKSQLRLAGDKNELKSHDINNKLALIT